MSNTHLPVLLNETMDMLRFVHFDEGWVIDGTFGRGGHTREILKTFPNSRVIALDWDSEAVEHGKAQFQPEIAAGRLEVHHKNFSDFQQALGDRPLVGVLLDLGVSSPQLDNAERGFSFYKDGPLDMRMDTRQQSTAAEIVNSWDEKELIHLFQTWGEIRRPHRVVNAIVADRLEQPFTRTQPLSEMIARVDGWRKKGHHPATNYFMALRIAVNSELEVIEQSLPSMAERLLPGGRLLVITFHSLEDRIAKVIFKGLSEKGLGLPVNKKVIQAGREEEKSNPRSRSAKLRVFEKGLMKKTKDKYGAKNG